MKVSSLRGGSADGVDTMYLTVYLTAAELTRMTGHSHVTKDLRGTLRQEGDYWMLKFGKEGQYAVQTAPNPPQGAYDPERTVASIRCLARNYGLNPPKITSMGIPSVEYVGQAAKFKLHEAFYQQTALDGSAKLSDAKLAEFKPIEALKRAIAQVNELTARLKESESGEVELKLVDGKLKASIVQAIEL